MAYKIPPVSIIIPSFNYADRIKSAIESVINQSVSDWECIIIDDGSQDNSVEEIQSAIQGDERFTLITHEDGKNHGLAASLQLALEYCRAPLLAFLEADDCWLPKSLAVRMAVMESHPGAVLCCNIPDIVIENGADGSFQLYLRQMLQYLIRTRGMPAKIHPSEIFALNPLCTFSCVMVRREQFAECSFESPHAPILDKWLWQQLCLKGVCLLVGAELTRWAIHNSSYMARSRESQKAKKALFVQKTRQLLLPEARRRLRWGIFLLLVFHGPATLFIRVATKFRVAGVGPGVRAMRHACMRIFHNR